MKKKILSLALAVALIAIVVSGSLAYFTDDDEVTNTFTVGSVLIEIFENDTQTTSDTMAFGKLTPVVKTPASTDESYIKKAVDVKNVGLNAAYIRTHLAIPTKLVGYLTLDVSTDWTKVAETTAAVEENGANVSYTVYTYDYATAVEPNAFTPELLKGVYLASDVDIKDNPATDTADLEFCKPDGNGGYTFSGYVAHNKSNEGYTSVTVNVLVASEAIQAQGFDNATTALNTGFGENTNPWQA